MKKIITIIMLCGVCHGYAQNTPPHAASTQTWVFGAQIWSDAIHMPECNKESFIASATEPQCRSYTENGKTWYYYNRAYVKKNWKEMCPTPWVLPTWGVCLRLKQSRPSEELYQAWGKGGLVWRGVELTRTCLFIWYGAPDDGFDLNCNMCGCGILDSGSNGYQVRCVK